MELLREEFTLLQRECLACGRAGASYLLLQPADEHDLSGIEEEARLLAAFEDKGQLPGHGLLVAVRVNDWSSELSPWEAPQPSGSALFGDGAPAFLEKLLALIPELQRRFGLSEDCQVLLGGYSLAGFFSLWAAYRTDAFQAVAAASPSLWFQGFMKYQRGRKPRVKAVSLSLGDKEEKTRNEMMASCGSAMRQYYEELSELMEPGALVLEWNPGGHFDENAKRTARAFYLAEKMLARRA
jgi:putative 30S ribosomal protein S12